MFSNVPAPKLSFLGDLARLYIGNPREITSVSDQAEYDQFTLTDDVRQIIGSFIYDPNHEKRIFVLSGCDHSGKKTLSAMMINSVRKTMGNTEVFVTDGLAMPCDNDYSHLTVLVADQTSHVTVENLKTLLEAASSGQTKLLIVNPTKELARHIEFHAKPEQVFWYCRQWTVDGQLKARLWDAMIPKPIDPLTKYWLDLSAGDQHQAQANEKMVMDFLAGSDVNGDILVIKGESGSGKSTLANLMKNTIFKIHPGPRAHKIHSRTRFPGPSYDINFDQCTNKRGRFVFVELEEGCGIGLPQLASIAKMMDEGINLVIVDPKNATDNCFFGIQSFSSAVLSLCRKAGSCHCATVKTQYSGAESSDSNRRPCSTGAGGSLSIKDLVRPVIVPSDQVKKESSPVPVLSQEEYDRALSGRIGFDISNRLDIIGPNRTILGCESIESEKDKTFKVSQWSAADALSKPCDILVVSPDKVLANKVAIQLYQKYLIAKPNQTVLTFAHGLNRRVRLPQTDSYNIVVIDKFDKEKLCSTNPQHILFVGCSDSIVAHGSESLAGQMAQHYCIPSITDLLAAPFAKEENPKQLDITRQFWTQCADKVVVVSGGSKVGYMTMPVEDNKEEVAPKQVESKQEKPVVRFELIQ